jgi:hypothetical protein
MFCEPSLSYPSSSSVVGEVDDDEQVEHNDGEQGAEQDGDDVSACVS